MEKQQCLKFIDFLSGHVPLQDKYSRKLVSADKKNGIAEYKNNFLVELAPICKDDLVILPKELAHNLSNISPLVLIKSVSSGIHIVDPLSGEVGCFLARLMFDVTSEHYCYSSSFFIFLCCISDKKSTMKNSGEIPLPPS